MLGPKVQKFHRGVISETLWQDSYGQSPSLRGQSTHRKWAMFNSYIAETAIEIVDVHLEKMVVVFIVMSTSTPEG